MFYVFSGKSVVPQISKKWTPFWAISRPPPLRAFFKPPGVAIFLCSGPVLEPPKNWKNGSPENYPIQVELSRKCCSRSSFSTGDQKALRKTRERSTVFLLLSLERCRKTRKWASHARWRSFFSVLPTEHGKLIFELCDTSREIMLNICPFFKNKK